MFPYMHSYAPARTSYVGSVLALVVLSLPRTLAVARMSASTGATTGFVMTIRNLYGATADAFAVILALAVWLAHG